MTDFEEYNTKFEEYSTKVGFEGANDTFLLPVDTLKVEPRPSIPGGGTLRRDYDERGWMEPMEFIVRLELEYAFERAGRYEHLDSVEDLVRHYAEMDPNDPDFLDAYIDPHGTGHSIQGQDFDKDKDIEDLIIDLEEGDAGVVFTQKQREKERTLAFETKDSNLSYDDIAFLFK